MSTALRMQPLVAALDVALLNTLTEELVAPGRYGLHHYEIGERVTVSAECLSTDRFLIARRVKLDTRIEDPEVFDRAAAPEAEFARRGGEWYLVRVSRGAYSGPEEDPHAHAVALLRLVAREQADSLRRLVQERELPRFPGSSLRRASGRRGWVARAFTCIRAALGRSRDDHR